MLLLCPWEQLQVYFDRSLLACCLSIAHSLSLTPRPPILL